CGIAHILGMRLGQIGEGEVVEIRLVHQHAHALIVDLEKRRQVVKVVGRPHLRHVLVGQRHAVPLRQLEFHFRLERPLQMHVQLAFRHARNEIAQITHESLLQLTLTLRPENRRCQPKSSHYSGLPPNRLHYSVSGIGVALPSASENCGMWPRPWIKLASAPSVFFQSWPSVRITPAPTMSAPAERASANVAARLEPVATTSSTTATRRPASSGTDRRSSISRCFPAEGTGNHSWTRAAAG